MPDRAAIDRAAIAEVALSGRWLSARTIQERLGLADDEAITALRDLVKSGDLDWDGVVLPDGWTGTEAQVRYHLPFREVSVRRRMEVAS